MAYVHGKTVRPERFGRLPDIQQARYAEARLNKGMVTMVDPADIELGAMQLIKNAYVRDDRTSRRPGTVLLSPEKPDNESVLRMAFMKKQNGVGYTFRFTPTTIHLRGSLAWTPITGTLAGTVADRIQTAVVFDQLLFANNGADYIQKIDLTANTFDRLGNAPKYRYITGFYNRLVGAARRDENEVEIGWSAEGGLDGSGLDEWNPLTNETAGASPLVESTSDLSDFITGIFAFNNVLVVLRERSVWLGTKQPIPTYPFSFHAVVPGIGCDAPHSATLVSGGIAWLDRRSGSVYLFSPGGNIEPIGRPVERTILANISDPQLVFGSYNPIENEYSICVPQVGSKLVNVWTYNMRNRAWSRQEYYDLSSLDDIDMASGAITIDDLGDVPIDTLSGTIDELSPTGNIIATRTFGRGDGTIAVEDINVDTDAIHADYVDPLAYETILVSKTFTIPENDIYVSQINIEYEAKRAGQFILEYSKNGGASDDSWRIAKIVNPSILGIPRLLLLRRMMKARRFAWRLRATAGLFETLSYEVHVFQSGESTK